MSLFPTVNLRRPSLQCNKKFYIPKLSRGSSSWVFAGTRCYDLVSHNKERTVYIAIHFCSIFQLMSQFGRYLYKTDTILIGDLSNCQNQVQYQPFFVDSQISELYIFASGSKNYRKQFCRSDLITTSVIVFKESALIDRHCDEFSEFITQRHKRPINVLPVNIVAAFAVKTVFQTDSSWCFFILTYPFSVIIA